MCYNISAAIASRLKVFFSRSMNKVHMKGGWTRYNVEEQPILINYVTYIITVVITVVENQCRSRCYSELHRCQ